MIGPKHFTFLPSQNFLQQTEEKKLIEKVFSYIRQ